MSTVIHSLLGWGIVNWRNTFGGSCWTSRCWRKTGWDGFSHSRLGSSSGTDRIGYLTDFAAPINCCWCGHTSHWCNRQHWVFIQLVEGVKRTWASLSFKIPLLCFSLKLEMRRWRPWFDHVPGPSQYGIVWKSHPIEIRLSCWLVDSGCSPNISIHFLDKNRLSRLQIHGSCGSVVVGLPPKQLLTNSGGFHVLANTGWKLWKGWMWSSSCQHLQWWWKSRADGCSPILQ